MTASYRGATRSVSVRIVPQLLNSTVVPNDYLFRDATGPYFYNLSANPRSTPANLRCALSATISPNAAGAWSLFQPVRTRQRPLCSSPT